MKKVLFLLIIILALCGCGRQTPAESQPTAATEATVPAETAAPEGNPFDVTCKSSYTGQSSENVTVAYTDDQVLCREELQVWYWMAVAAHQASDSAIQPDYASPLDAQSCPLDDTVNTWQQYFLRQALNNWHTATVLNLESETVPMATEEAYKPDWSSHALRLVDIPATKYLYGHNVYYQVNTLHEKYLDTLPQLLQELAEAKGYADVQALALGEFGTDSRYLRDFTEDYNRAYMYFTALAYYIEPTQEELDAYFEANAAAEDEYTVDIRHLLLVPQDIIQEPEKKRGSKETEPTEPIILEDVQVAADGTVTCSEEAWSICEGQAETLLQLWVKGKADEYDFAHQANQDSYDHGTSNDGGAYHNIRKGQLQEQLDEWCFDPSRQSGDVTMIRTQYGIHLLYFSSSDTVARSTSREDYLRQQQSALLEDARKRHDLYVDYQAITLGHGGTAVNPSELLYPDVGHERFPEIPLYLQQDYPTTMYGSFPIRTHGCGITTMAMLASYMADDELTPPEMCARFGRYCYVTGTDGRLFSETPAEMGFYCRERTYDVRAVLAALEEGQIVISCQHKGYWTRGGHYIALEKITEDRMVQVRDSNIFNYVKLSAHKNDLHRWSSIVQDGAGYWIFEDKVVTIPACQRCGDPDGLTNSLVLQPYTCHKCDTALLRRNTFLNWDGGNVLTKKSVPNGHALFLDQNQTFR